MRKNFAGSNATLLPRFFCLCPQYPQNIQYPQNKQYPLNPQTSPSSEFTSTIQNITISTISLSKSTSKSSFHSIQLVIHTKRLFDLTHFSKNLSCRVMLYIIAVWVLSAGEWINLVISQIFQSLVKMLHYSTGMTDWYIVANLLRIQQTIISNGIIFIIPQAYLFHL